METQWEFRIDPGGRGWYWICMDQGSLSESAERFETPAECIEDAERHGYSTNGGACHAAHE
jgi:hypothetical protein